MRIAASILTALVLATLCAGCADEPVPRSSPGSKMWQTGTRVPTVTLTEPAGGPVRD